MMAITTKHIPATNTKPTRIKAFTESGLSMTISVHALPDSNSGHPDVMHYAAAAILAAKYGWDKPPYGRMIQGGVKDGYVHVFTE